MARFSDISKDDLGGDKGQRGVLKMLKLKIQSSKLTDLKVAIVAEELTQLGGAERVLDCLLELFPKATVFTLVWNNQKTENRYQKLDVRPSFIQKMPFGIKRYKWYLPLMPKAIESFNLKRFDLVISSASALIKGVTTSPDQLHICYCHTPTRYLWLETKSYLKSAPIPFFIRPIMPIVIWFLRRWDLKASQRPDFYIANSVNTKNRIKKYYNRDSHVIFPPVDAKKFHPLKTKGQYFLVVSRIEPYKKVDLVIEAFKELKLPLKIVGGGTRFEEYRQNISSNSMRQIELAGRLSDDELIKYYQNAIAVIFPQEEDAGIVPLEAMACGRPVIAYGRGGASESIIDGKTGILFKKQTVEDLILAVKRFQKITFDPTVIRQHAQKFDKVLFKKKVLEYIIDKSKFKIQKSK